MKNLKCLMPIFLGLLFSLCDVTYAGDNVLLVKLDEALAELAALRQTSLTAEQSEKVETVGKKLAEVSKIISDLNPLENEKYFYAKQVMNEMSQNLDSVHSPKECPFKMRAMIDLVKDQALSDCRKSEFRNCVIDEKYGRYWTVLDYHNLYICAVEVRVLGKKN